MLFSTKGMSLIKDGAPFVMKGFNLGNWMMLERFMFGFPGVDQLFRRYFKYYAGEEKYNWFFDLYYKTYFQEQDAIAMKAMGCNTIRIPFNYRVFEDDLQPYKYNPQPFAYMDYVVELCARYGIYSIIDYHAVQGYENAFHCCDNITGVMELYHNAECQNRCVKLWEYVAEHFKGNPNVIGYDLINEPGPKDDEVEQLKELYRKIIKAVRAIDKKHILFLEGPALSNRFDVMDEVFDDNMGYTPHYYHSGPKFTAMKDERDWYCTIEQDIEARSSMCKKLNIPCWFGEMGISKGPYESVRLRCMDITLELLNQKHYSWNLWTWKDLYRMGMYSTAEDSPWRKQTELFIDLKAKYRLDASNVDVWECTDVFFENFDRDFKAYEQVKDFSVDGNRLDNLKHRLWNNATNAISEILVEDYAKLFADKPKDILEEMISSFSLENCVRKDNWYQVFYKHMR